jgi:uncharacterized protein (DUF4415 family)
MTSRRITRISRDRTDKKRGRTDWRRLREMTEAEIRAAAESDADAALTTPEFWDTAHLVLPRPPKTQVTLRLDADLLDWFRAQGRGYQTRINAVLRSYMEHVRTHERAPSARKRA